MNLTSSRAIAFTSTGLTITEAREKALHAINFVSGNISFRTDIGSQELIQAKIDLVNSFNT